MVLAAAAGWVALGRSVRRVGRSSGVVVRDRFKDNTSANDTPFSTDFRLSGGFSDREKLVQYREEVREYECNVMSPVM